MEVNQVRALLLELGRRLRRSRLERNDTMAIFAERLGIAERTVRAMERGAPTVQIETWLNALWLLNQLHLLDALLQPRGSVLDRIQAQQKPQKQRASRRKR
jgi:transcriptional regulator with XRE-family HTH domain